MKNGNGDVKLSSFAIKVIPETHISALTESSIIILLEQCFPGVFQGRSYFKQLPHGRILADDGCNVVGHASYDLRVMRLDDRPMWVFDIIDLCVAVDQRCGGIGASLLRTAIDCARETRADAILLVTQQPTYYAHFGFETVDAANVTWLGIEDRRSISLLAESLAGELMQRIEDKSRLPHSQIDMLGYMY